MYDGEVALNHYTHSKPPIKPHLFDGEVPWHLLESEPMGSPCLYWETLCWSHCPAPLWANSNVFLVNCSHLPFRDMLIYCLPTQPCLTFAKLSSHHHMFFQTYIKKILLEKVWLLVLLLKDMLLIHFWQSLKSLKKYVLFFVFFFVGGALGASKPSRKCGTLQYMVLTCTNVAPL